MGKRLVGQRVVWVGTHGLSVRLRNETSHTGQAFHRSTTCVGQPIGSTCQVTLSEQRSHLLVSFLREYVSQARSGLPSRGAILEQVPLDVGALDPVFVQKRQDLLRDTSAIWSWAAPGHIAEADVHNVFDEPGEALPKPFGQAGRPDAAGSGSQPLPFNAQARPSPFPLVHRRSRRPASRADGRSAHRWTHGESPWLCKSDADTRLQKPRISLVVKILPDAHSELRRRLHTFAQA